jgi:hypothetical protein
LAPFLKVFEIHPESTEAMPSEAVDVARDIAHISSPAQAGGQGDPNSLGEVF